MKTAQPPQQRESVPVDRSDAALAAAAARAPPTIMSYRPFPQYPATVEQKMCNCAECAGEKGFYDVPDMPIHNHMAQQGYQVQYMQPYPMQPQQQMYVQQQQQPQYMYRQPMQLVAPPQSPRTRAPLKRPASSENETKMYALYYEPSQTKMTVFKGIDGPVNYLYGETTSKVREGGGWCVSWEKVKGDSTTCNDG